MPTAVANRPERPATLPVALQPPAELTALLAGYVKKTLAAPVYDVAIETPLQAAPALSQRLGNHILLKREDLQPTFSFKIRGAYNKLAQLTAEERARGVVTASAGNHAQGVALAARELGIRAIIVMPTTTPSLKVDGVRSRGGEAVLHGDAFPQALAHALSLAEQGYTFVPPFDDAEVIAGQGTVAMEILRQQPGALDAIFVPVGGGGLIAGIAAYVKYLRPEVRVIGVEPHDSNCLQMALAAGERVMLPQVGSFADGVAVAQVGAHPFALCRHLVDEVVTVSSDELCAAIKDIYDDTRSITEPSGALGVAGIKRYVARHGISGQTLVAIDSGANVNFDRLRHVAERAELGEQREAIIAVTVPERPGSFRLFCQALGRRQITEFNYRYHSDRAAHLFVGVQTHPVTDPRSVLLESLGRQGFAVLDMTDDELAKAHLRHTVGGHALHGEEECLLRFEFPERPGALLKFLQELGERWNISLFHYRNHGAADARVLVALQVAPERRGEVGEQLRVMGYRYWDESENPAYPDLSHRPSAEGYLKLIAEESADEHAQRGGQPYPFFLAHALQQPVDQFENLLGAAENWQVEWKWDGIRAQVVKREGRLWIWSRGEELVTDRFPELHSLTQCLPDGTVIDGEIVVWKAAAAENAEEGEFALDTPAPGTPGEATPSVQPFALLQQRIGRKTLGKKILEDVPVVVLAYDLLEWEGHDWRSRPQHERRTQLERVIANAQSPVLMPSPVLTGTDWLDLGRQREASRSLGVEGMMLKARDSLYGVGRTKDMGVWWKWKMDPFSVDAVLIYAQRGHGRRASLYSDYTFAVWDGPPESSERTLVPFAKAYSGLTDEEMRKVDAIIRKTTVDKFGPVRSVTPTLVFELGFEGIALSKRHKSGIAVRFPRMLRWRLDKPVAEADSLATLQDLLA